MLLAAAALELRALGGDVVFPLIDERSLAGMLVIGPKRSGDPYFAGDIDLLSTLVIKTAVAMKNAHLYREVVRVNEYVDNILSTMASGVIAVDASGQLTLSNPAAERLTGMRLRLPNLSYNELPLTLAGPLRETLTEGKAYSQLETSIQTPEGLMLPLVYSTASLQDKDGTTHGALIVFSDLTRLKELEREKHRAERLASFGSLASGVAHEIKNPLVAIRTFAELLPKRLQMSISVMTSLRWWSGKSIALTTLSRVFEALLVHLRSRLDPSTCVSRSPTLSSSFAVSSNRVTPRSDTWSRTKPPSSP